MLTVIMILKMSAPTFIAARGKIITYLADYFPANNMLLENIYCFFFTVV